MSGQERNQQALSSNKRKDTGLRLTPRDRVLLRFRGEQYACCQGQAQRLLAKYSPEAEKIKTSGTLSEQTTRDRLRALEKAGYLHSSQPLTAYAPFFWLTRAGYQTAGLPFRVMTPSLGDLEHIYWCAQVRLWLLLHDPDKEQLWRSERWLRHELDQKIKQVDLPDALIPLASGGTIAVEFERTVKGPVRLIEALRSRALIYEQVWYICPQTSLKAVQTAHSTLDPLYRNRLFVYKQEQYQC